MIERVEWFPNISGGFGVGSPAQFVRLSRRAAAASSARSLPSFTCLLISDYSFGSGESPSNYDAPLIPNASANNSPLLLILLLSPSNGRNENRRGLSVERSRMWERNTSDPFRQTDVKFPIFAVVSHTKSRRHILRVSAYIVGVGVVAVVGHENFAPFIGNWGL